MQRLDAAQSPKQVEDPGRFLFRRMLGYAKEALNRPNAQIDAVLREKVVITCREILRNAMAVSVVAVYRKAAKKDK